MKKILTVGLLICAMFFLFGCDQSTADNSEPAAEEETAQQSDQSQLSAEENADGTQAQTGTEVPDSAKMDQIFQEASEVYQWFDLNPLAVETNDNGETVMYSANGNDYCGKVNDDRASSLKDLETALHRYFSDDICNELMGYGLYVEENGVLYEVIADRGSDITRGNIEKSGVTNSTDNLITYTVTVETINPGSDTKTGTEDINYNYEKINGKWVFTSFKAIY